MHFLNKVTSWRIQQIEQYGNDFVIKQDHELIEFVKKCQAQRLLLQGETDLAYFSKMLPGCEVVDSAENTCVLAIIGNRFGLNFESFLSKIQQSIVQHNPRWVYIAINKYLVVTEQSWPNLTNDYDADLLNIVQNQMNSIGFKELVRYYNSNDDGSYFNFAHPTTNAYYESIR